MATLFGTINHLVPFTNPSTPFWQDVVHAIALCAFLYFAPNLPWRRVAEGFWSIGPKPMTQAEVARGPGLQPSDGHRQEVEEAELRWGEREVEDEMAEEDRDMRATLEPPGNANDEADPRAVEGRIIIEEADAANPRPQAQRRRDPNKPVGAKKAKSLARRDQIRAYHEFQRVQGDAQRARDAEGAAEREQQQKKERERRHAVEIRIEQQKADERRKRKEEAEVKMKADIAAREEVERSLRAQLRDSGLVKLEAVAHLVGRDCTFVEETARKEGLLGLKDFGSKKVFTMITRPGWIVRVDDDIMRQVYTKAGARNDGGDDGRVSWDDFKDVLEGAVKSR